PPIWTTTNRRYRAPLQKEMKIISGGQTGVDRAALDLALKHQMPCCGWCPSGRLDEHGRIPDRYPVTELPNGDFAARTRQNVIDSDATIIFHRRELIGGTELAVQCCLNYKRPHLLIDAATVSADEAARVVVEFLRSHNIDNLN